MTTLKQLKVNGVSYRLLTRKCGNKRCRCATGDGHGPYWYAFDGNGGGGKYIGAKLPDDVVNREKLMKLSAGQIKKVKDDVRKRIDDHQRELDRARRELSVLDALQRGDYAAPRILESLGLGQLVIQGEMKG